MNGCKFNYIKPHSELDKKRKEKNLTWAAVGQKLGIALSTLKRSEIGQSMEADGVRAMVAWLNLAPEDFIYGINSPIIPQTMKCVPVSNDKVSRSDKIALFTD